MDPLKGSTRPAVIVEFAVVVVFDDRGTVQRGERQQLLSPVDGHQPAGGVLVGRGDENQSRPIAPAPERKPAAIKPHTTHHGPPSLKRRAPAPIPRPFLPTN